MDGFIMFCQRVLISQNCPKNLRPKELSPPMAATGLLGPDLVKNWIDLFYNLGYGQIAADIAMH